MQIEGTTKLNNGNHMPLLGFGTYNLGDENTVFEAVSHALSTGYKSIDTASFYENEEQIGLAINQSSVPRNEIFLTTKVWTDDLRQERVTQAFEESLTRLKQDFVDLYLIHWPVDGYYIDAWKELEAIYKSGRAKAIGVSNFTISQLKTVIDRCEIVPMVNQIEHHRAAKTTQLLRTTSYTSYCMATVNERRCD